MKRTNDDRKEKEVKGTPSMKDFTIRICHGLVIRSLGKWWYWKWEYLHPCYNFCNRMLSRAWYNLSSDTFPRVRNSHEDQSFVSVVPFLHSFPHFFYSFHYVHSFKEVCETNEARKHTTNEWTKWTTSTCPFQEILTKADVNRQW